MSVTTPSASTEQDRPWWFWARVAALALVALGWSLVAHLASTQVLSHGWTTALALTPMSVAAVLALFKLPTRWATALGVLLLLVLLIWAWPLLNQQVAWVYYTEHLGVYLLLAAFFGRTLRGPGEPLVTQMARWVHAGRLSPAQESYTRKVTWVWTLFFLGMASVSTLLFLLAPVAVWSTFANLLGGPLIGLVFLVEYLWRRVALAGEDKATMADAIRAWKAHNASKA